MSRYTYNQQLQPPAAFVHLTLRTPDNTKATGEVPAQLDTGADKTAIPWRLVEELGLIQFRNVPATGLGGQVITFPAFVVQAAIRGLSAVVVEALARREEPFVLLRRDVLNRFRLLLDGPRLVFELE